jgi:hypothetical protein
VTRIRSVRRSARVRHRQQMEIRSLQRRHCSSDCSQLHARSVFGHWQGLRNPAKADAAVTTRPPQTAIGVRNRSFAILPSRVLIRNVEQVGSLQ